MRGILLLLVLAGSAHADPFDHPWPPGHVAPAVPSTDGAHRRHVGEGVAIAGAALVVASVALSVVEKRDYDADVMRHDATAANHAVDVTRFGATAIGATGAIAIGVGVALYLTAKPERLVVAPTIAPGGFGIAARATF